MDQLLELFRVNAIIYTPNYDWSWCAYSYPVYNYNTFSYSTYNHSTYNYPSYDYSSYFNPTPSYTIPSTNNYHASNDVKILANTKITQLDSDTQLGRQLPGKLSRSNKNPLKFSLMGL